jgi:Tol biopolymer transport system component
LTEKVINNFKAVVMTQYLKWKVLSLVATCLSIFSMMILVQPVFGYDATNFLISEAPASKFKSNLVNGRIAFSYIPDGSDMEIYTINPDGTDPERLTDNAYQDYSPAWSPDGTQIVFFSFRPDSQIYIINSDGTNERKLTSEGELNHLPAWSHNGKKIVYCSWQGDNNEIYIMDVDGRHKQRLTYTSANEYWPSWSPDDSEIVYSSTANGDCDIYKMKISNNRVSHITSFTNNNESNPEMSPDGTKIVYDSYSFQSTGFPAIWVVDANGENAYQIQKSDGGVDPFWSPDGEYILYQDVYNSNKLYTMNPDGTNPKPVSDYFTTCFYSSWGPAVNAKTD